ncbi:hypothetical protein DL93DRAFT_2057611 [Clavulina sp. PMI_390]|nr:hypothetical protein DL93DRAFT_2057611 [Clavulina sp. PMI_390]
MPSTAVGLSASRSANAYAPSTTTASTVFEFTKRKKWADLLITELSGTLILVLSTSCEVLYCGAAAIELLGWREEEVIDTNLVELMHQDDVAPFQAHFDSCIASRSEMSTYARLRGKAGSESEWPVFEFRGHPHYEGGDFQDCRCFFVMARPHPTRNTAMLDSFLELRVENERLRQRLIDLRPSASSYPPPPYLSGAPISNVRGGGADVMFPSDSLNSMALNMSSIYSSGAPVSLARTYQPHYFAGPPLRRVSTPTGDAMEEARKVAAAGSVVSGQSDDNGSVAGSTKASTAPQYVCVTCGRTDSPEWRKGPMGAKTLCNACGLRWAKRNQKKKQESAAAAASTADEEPVSSKASATEEMMA